MTAAYYPDLGYLLRLQAKLNASTIRPGGAIAASITLSNPLAVNLSAMFHTNGTIQNWNGFDFICGNSMLPPVGFALFKGHYTSANVSSGGSPLTLTPPIYPPCAIFASPALYVVLPNSSNAIAYYKLPTQPPSYFQPTQVQLRENATTGYCSVTPVGSTTCGSIRNALFGYLNTTGMQGPLDNATTTSKYFHYFSPGWYTLVVEDVWGQVLYEYFEVVSAA